MSIANSLFFLQIFLLSVVVFVSFCFDNSLCCCCNKDDFSQVSNETHAWGIHYIFIYILLGFCSLRLITILIFVNKTLFIIKPVENLICAMF